MTMVRTNSNPDLEEGEKKAEYEAPDPKLVGHEFVKQYYTLLHEGPQYLHLFYSNQSTFIHGGSDKEDEEEVVMGQADIRKKIESLNFQDCRARILQIDCQETLGGAVLVQTAGEIFTGGLMRRFMQTFVLVQKGPKSFYLRNDIFRYQDEVFDDKDSETEEKEMQELAEDEAYVETSVEMPLETGVAVQEDSPAVTETVSAILEDNSFLSPETPSEAVEEEEGEGESLTPVQAALTIEYDPEPETQGDSLEERQGEVQGESGGDERQETCEDLPSTQPEEDLEAEPAPEAEQAPKGPRFFTWAELVCKQSPPVVGTQTKAAVVVKPKPEVKPETGAAAAVSVSRPPPPSQPPRPSRSYREGNVVRDRSNSARGDEGGPEGGRGFGIGSKYPDNQQLFVGNLPHNMSESELRVFFGQYGTVLELRINTKSSGGRLPNFGFVIFDNPDTVQDILSKKPIHFNGEHRLNVEEKKTRGFRNEGRPMGRGGGGGGRYGSGGPRNFGNRGGGKSGGEGWGGEGERRGMGRGGQRGGQRGGMFGQ